MWGLETKGGFIISRRTEGSFCVCGFVTPLVGPSHPDISTEHLKHLLQRIQVISEEIPCLNFHVHCANISISGSIEEDFVVQFQSLNYFFSAKINGIIGPGEVL